VKEAYHSEIRPGVISHGYEQGFHSEFIWQGPFLPNAPPRFTTLTRQPLLNPQAPMTTRLSSPWSALLSSWISAEPTKLWNITMSWCRGLVDASSSLLFAPFGALSTNFSPLACLCSVSRHAGKEVGHSGNCTT